MRDLCGEHTDACFCLEWPELVSKPCQARILPANSPRPPRADKRVSRETALRRAVPFAATRYRFRN